MNPDAPNHSAHSRAMPFWEDVIDDMEATAAEYEDADWDVVQLHPGDVTPIVDDEDRYEEPFGLDVLVPGNEYEAVVELLDAGVAFDAFEAYRASEDGMVFLVVAVEDHDTETAVCYPAYYDVDGARDMLDAATDAGRMYTFVRTLQGERVTFTHDDADAFQPPARSDPAASGTDANDADGED